MSCKRCPHHVRHGFADQNGQIAFHDLCGLKVKKLEREEMEKAASKKQPVDKKVGATKAPPKRYTAEQFCDKVPFGPTFEYVFCDVYFATFKTVSAKNDVVPTKDFQYSDAFNSISITDMELL